MKACTRCGRLHTDAEKIEKKDLSCTEVKQFWNQIKKEHKQKYGHLPRIIRNDNEEWICMECGKCLLE